MKRLWILLAFIPLIALAQLAFAPTGPSIIVGTTAVQVTNLGTSQQVRVRNLSSSAQYFSWGSCATLTPPTTAGANTEGVLPTSVEIFTLPPNQCVIAQTSTGFEMTPGAGL